MNKKTITKYIHNLDDTFTKDVKVYNDDTGKLISNYVEEVLKSGWQECSQEEYEKYVTKKKAVYEQGIQDKKDILAKTRKDSIMVLEKLGLTNDQATVIVYGALV